MSLTYNNTAVKKITLNGDDVKHLDYNGTRTWDAYRTMTVYIDENDPNPYTCCTYGDDAVGMTPGSDEWDDFFGHYPCMLLNGVEGQKLQRNNFALHEDGTPADITTGDEGDVMICFPRRGLVMSKTDGVIKITMTDNLETPGFEYMAHRRGETVNDKFYVGAYRGWVNNNVLNSLSGKTGYNYTKSRANARAYAHAKGSGYDNRAFYQLTYNQAMYVLKYKNLASSNTIGKGLIYPLNGMGNVGSGASNTIGMDGEYIVETNWKDSKENIHYETHKGVKLFGIEDFWGATLTGDGEFVDGILQTRSHAYAATTGFDDVKNNNYKQINDYSWGSSADLTSGYMVSAEGNTLSGFIRSKVSSVSSDKDKYYMTYVFIGNNTNPGEYNGFILRNDVNNGRGTGIFALYCSNDGATRLMYL